MKKNIFFFLALASLTQANEVSVFGAGNLNSKNPYGLNNTEKHILINKKKINKVDSSLKDLKSNVNSIKQRVEAIESIYEGDSKKLNSSVLKLNSLVNSIDNNKNSGVKLTSDVQELRVVSEQLALLQEENNKSVAELKKALVEITSLVNKINNTYVSSRELKSNMNQFITKAEFNELKKALGLSVQSNKNSSSKKTNLQDKVKLTNADKKKLLVDAKALFKKQYFKYAIPKFERLVEENYKPAESNYYLGEMWYVRKKYDLAISHFKKSAILYDKAAYMPTLLLHSAISFEKIKDKENARTFYSTLIDLYPESKETKIAKKNLSNL